MIINPGELVRRKDGPWYLVKNLYWQYYSKTTQIECVPFEPIDGFAFIRKIKRLFGIPRIKCEFISINDVHEVKMPDKNLPLTHMQPGIYVKAKKIVACFCVENIYGDSYYTHTKTFFVDSVHRGSVLNEANKDQLTFRFRPDELSDHYQGYCDDFEIVEKEEPKKEEPPVVKQQEIKVGDRVRVLRNEAGAGAVNKSGMLEKGDVITVSELKLGQDAITVMNKSEKYHDKIVVLYDRKFTRSDFVCLIPLEDVELVESAPTATKETPTIKVGDKVRVLRNSVLAHTPEGNTLDYLKSGDTVVILKVSEGEPYLYYKAKCSWNGANYVLRKDVELVVEEKKEEPQQIIKVGDRVRVLRNYVHAGRAEKTGCLTEGDVITVSALKLGKDFLECQYNKDKYNDKVVVLYNRVFCGYQHFIPLEDVELVVEEKKEELPPVIKAGDKVRVLRNSVLAHTPEGNTLDYLKSGDTILISTVSGDGHYLYYKAKSSWNGANYVLRKDVELVVEEKKEEPQQIIKAGNKVRVLRNSIHANNFFNNMEVKIGDVLIVKNLTVMRSDLHPNYSKIQKQYHGKWVATFDYVAWLPVEDLEVVKT